MPTKNIELIHQWQALGKVPAELLKDKAFENCKKVGLTSLQSYVYWAEIEKRPGVVDFSTYDEVVEKIRKHGLKWVPFLILGPYYATPKWFQKTSESVYAKCLEHEKESKVQSIWSPYLPKYVDRFLQLFSKHYRDPSVIESIELGISGSWGEALYPTDEGFLQPHEGFHVHPGWWCGDKYAISSFRSSMKKKYGQIEKINTAWGEQFSRFDEINFPEIKPSFHHWYVDSMKNLVKFGTKVLSGRSTIWDKNSIGLTRIKYPSFRGLKKNLHERRRWLDFVQWYLGSMTKWAAFWVKTARKYLPNVEIYLATGGDGNPFLGADFSAQTKMATNYGAGIRITNQTDNYAESFVLTRLVASASRFFGTYFTTEESLLNQPHGVTMRIFEASTSGAKGVYFKNIVGGDVGATYASSYIRPKRYVWGEPTENVTNFTQNRHHLTSKKPIIDAAVLFPNSTIALNPEILWSIYEQSSQLRDVLDFDLVDENLIVDDALRKYRFFVIIDGGPLAGELMTKIKKWIKAGGILISTSYSGIHAIEDGGKLHDYLGLCPGITKVGRGHGVLTHCKGRDYLEIIKSMIYNRKKKYPWIGIPEIDDEWDGVYAARFSNKIMYFNSTDIPKVKCVKIGNLAKKFEFKLNIQPHSIARVDLATSAKRA